jgi:plasmid stabilization system protein ParE
VKYRVDVTRPARQDIGDIYAYHREHVPGSADRWLVGVHRAMGTLSEMPHRCPIARESETATGTVRNLLYRDYRIVV